MWDYFYNINSLACGQFGYVKPMKVLCDNLAGERTTKFCCKVRAVSLLWRYSFEFQPVHVLTWLLHATVPPSNNFSHEKLLFLYHIPPIKYSVVNSTPAMEAGVLRKADDRQQLHVFITQKKISRPLATTTFQTDSEGEKSVVLLVQLHRLRQSSALQL
jgi:hypothetical protein